MGTGLCIDLLLIGDFGQGMALPCLGPLKSQPVGLVCALRASQSLHRLTLSSSRCLALRPHPT